MVSWQWSLILGAFGIFPKVVFGRWSLGGVPVVGARRHLESLKKFPKAVIVGGLLAVVNCWCSSTFGVFEKVF